MHICMDCVEFVAEMKQMHRIEDDIPCMGISLNVSCLRNVDFIICMTNTFARGSGERVKAPAGTESLIDSSSDLSFNQNHTHTKYC